ncbi:MAG: hypothetical protein AABY64_14375 [Bdellovibrionota bacterium]
MKNLLIAFIIFAGFYSQAEEIAIVAEKNGIPNGIKKFKLINNKCYIEKMKKIAELNTLQCGQLKKVMKQIGGIKQAKDPDYVPQNGQLYKVKAGKVFFNTLAQAPRECEIKSDGELRCVNITLTESQKIIRDLLALDSNNQI